MIDMTRRAFLATTAGIFATLAGCGGEDTYVDGGRRPVPDGGTNAGTSTYQLETGYLSLACRFPADLDLRTGNSVAALCTSGGSQPGDHNHLARFNPAATARPILSSVLKDIEDVDGRFLNQFTELSASFGVVTANDGLYEVPLSGSGSPRHIPFPAGVTYATGALRVGDKLFVATANLNGAAYDTGTLQIYDLAADGSILDGTRRSRNTSRRNPTGLTLLSDSSILVLNSGDYTPSATASLDFFDPDDETLIAEDTIELGALTAQNMGEIAVEGDTAVIGTADGTGRVLRVNLATGEVATQTLAGTRFHSSIKTTGGRALVTDFNSGLLTLLDLLTGGILQTFNLREALGVPSGQNVEAGPSEVFAGAFIQAIPYGGVRVYPT